MIEIIAIILSILSFIFSIISWIVTNKINKSELELEIMRMISESKDKFANIKDDVKADIIDYFIEEELNAYDHACLFYIENKINKKSFKKLYKTEIINIVENRTFSEIAKFSDIDCKYYYLKKVYEEWTIVK